MSLRHMWEKERSDLRVLQVKDLTVCYGKAEALKSISLEVDGEGTIIAVLGANGAGKTTLLRTVSGLMRPSSGEIRFQGERINNLRPHEIVKLGISHVPEGRRIFMPMKVEDNLRLGAYLRNDHDGVSKDIENLYRTFPVLKERGKQIAGSLSGGEQQMLAIARGLMTGPELLLLDEPSVGLSPLLVREMGNIITNIKEEGRSILLVEQNVHMALSLSEKAYILQTGRIVLEEESKKIAGDARLTEAYIGMKGEPLPVESGTRVKSVDLESER